MLGWEFPPKMSGGLGTACRGLANALVSRKNTELIFVVPSLPVKVKRKGLKLVHAEESTTIKTTYYDKKTRLPIQIIRIESELHPYKLPTQKIIKVDSYRESTERVYQHTKIKTVKLKGGYGPDLYEEVYDYTILAQSIADKHDFDLIHAHDWMTFQAGIAAKKISGKPLILHVHSTDFDRSPSHPNPQIHDIEQWGLHEADKIIAVSNYAKKVLLDKYSVWENKIEVIHNAIGKQLLKPKFSIQKVKKEKWVSFIGRITEQKGPWDFIEMARIVLRRVPNTRFILAGDGDQLAAIKHKILEYRLQDKIITPGFLNESEVSGLLSKSDAFVMPSVSEPFGIAALEAALANVAIVVSENSGVKEVLPNAITVKPGDFYALADRITWLLTEPWYADGVRDANLEVLNELTWDNTAIKIEDIYTSLVDK